MNSQVARSSSSEDIVQLPPAPSGAGVDVLAVTEDDLFLLAIRKIVALPNRVWHATSDTQAADMLVSTPCAAVLLDCALLTARTAGVVSRLHQQFPDVGFVVTGETSDEGMIKPLLETAQIQSFVPKQHAERRLAQGLEAAINRHFELKVEPVQAAAQPPWKRPPALAGLAAAIAVAAGLAAWITGKDEVSAPAAPEDVPGTASTMPQAQQLQAVEQELQQAREAFEAARYLAAEDSDSALEHYRAALSLDPVNAEAKEGLNRITEILLARTELALVQGNTREAAEALKAAKSIDGAHPRIAFLETQISREVTRTATERQEAARVEELNRKLSALSKTRTQASTANEKGAAKTAGGTAGQQAASASEADRLLALGYERLNQGRLLQPANDNTKDYFWKFKQLYPDHPSLNPAISALRERLLTETQQALDKRNPDLAQSMLDGARSVGADEARVGELGAALAKLSLQTQLLTNPEVLQSSMIVRQSTPTYPSRAQRERIEGHVDLRFVATTEGDVKNVVVVGAQPEGYFDEEAIRAVQRWKVKPRKIEGEAYEQLYSLRMRFKLD